MGIRSLQVSPGLAGLKRTLTRDQYAFVLHEVNENGHTDDEAFALMLYNEGIFIPPKLIPSGVELMIIQNEIPF